VNGIADRVVSERQLRPAGQPRVSLEGEPPMDPAKPADLNVKVELELLPEITLPELGGITLTRLRAEVADEAVAKALESVVQQNRSLEEVDEVRPAVTGDVLVVDFKGFIDGVAFNGGEAKDAPVEVGGSGFIPGFTEQIEGLSPGESRTISVTFPAEYQAAELAGKDATFEIDAKTLKKLVTPELDDAFAVKLGLESLENLREAVTSQIQREYDQMARLRIKRELLDALAEKADFPSPQNLLEAEFAAIWQRVEADRREGRVDEDDAGKDDDTLRAEYRTIADRRVRLGLLLSEIGRANDISVTQQELTQALRAEASRYPGQEMQVIEFFTKQQGAIEQLRGPIFEDKVVDYILSVAQVTEQVVAPEALALPGAEGAVVDAQAEAAPEAEAEATAAEPAA
jgi:trigger factor